MLLDTFTEDFIRRVEKTNSIYEQQFTNANVAIVTARNTFFEWRVKELHLLTVKDDPLVALVRATRNTVDDLVDGLFNSSLQTKAEGEREYYINADGTSDEAEWEEIEFWDFMLLRIRRADALYNYCATHSEAHNVWPGGFVHKFREDHGELPQGYASAVHEISTHDDYKSSMLEGVLNV